MLTRRLLLLTLAALLAPAPAPAEAADPWLRPVDGVAARDFDYGRRSPFAKGQHRGVDLVASSGTAVRSACTGRVVFAGRTPGYGRTVSVRCGARRVAYLPLRAVRVRAGDPVARGGRIGRVAAGHGGALHVGVRVEARRFGYVDPLALFGEAATSAPLLAPRAGPPPRRAPRPPSTPRVRLPAPGVRPAPALAPWPVWLGLALVLLGAAGGGGLAVRRRRRVTIPVPRPAWGRSEAA